MTSELIGIESAENLKGIARNRKSREEFRTVANRDVSGLVLQGWQVVRRGKATSRISKIKPHDIFFEDRVWALMFGLGFSLLSGDRNCVLSNSRYSTTNQIDVFAADEDVGLAIECKSSQNPSKRSAFQNEIGKFHALRESLALAVKALGGTAKRRQVGIALFLNNAILSDTDRQRAASSNVPIFTEQDLTYYEELVGHLGHAARYQFLADCFQGRDIPGLSITIPAIRSRQGSRTFYSFSLSPAYLLKIAYISHRRKGSHSDVGTYQRMMSPSRLKAIRRYIEAEGAVFPTNIVLNLDGIRRFDRSKQEGVNAEDLLGWLTLKPKYRSAWIIDGQHRLFAYADSAKAESARLSVVAFDGLDANTQAQMFVDINSKQKSVRPALLQELYAELHSDAEDPRLRMAAVVSQAVQELDRSYGAPFYGRILASEERRTTTRCIQFSSVFKALNQPDLFVTSVRRGRVNSYGPLYSGEDNAETIARTLAVMNSWFGAIRDSVPEWWELGSEDGGGLAMAGSVVSQIMVLRSVLEHLEKIGNHLERLETSDLVASIQPYSRENGEYLATLSEDERESYRKLVGSPGLATRARRSQLAIQTVFPDFSPDGLDAYKQQIEQQTNRRATDIVKEIETLLQAFVVRELKTEFGEAESGWWMQGVPRQVRLRATTMYEDDQGKRGGKEYYFDLVDYREIARSNWMLLRPFLGFGRANDSKDKQTSWIVEVNDRRKEVMHVSSGKNITIEQLDSLEIYRSTLLAKINYVDSDAQQDEAN